MAGREEMGRGRESTYNTVNSQMSNWWGEGSREGGVVYGKQRTKSDSGLSTVRGSGPCLLVDKVNGKSVFHARSINTAPARRDKFL